jgi:hypothetical protein
MVGGLASLPDFLDAECRRRGMEQGVASELIDMLPRSIREAPCFLDRLTSLWRYDFGEPFVMGDQYVYGTHMYQEVETLLNVLVFVRRRLEPAKREAYLTRLGNADKHEDVLIECAPVLRLNEDIPVFHERSGHGESNATIDWIIGALEKPTVLLEVKNRSRDLLESIKRLQAGDRDPDGSAPAPTHSPELLFRSVEAKFRSSPEARPIQAVWIHTSVKQEEAELEEAIGKLDRHRVHSVLLGDWKDDVYALSRSGEENASLLTLLSLRGSNRWAFHRLGRE